MTTTTKAGHVWHGLVESRWDPKRKYTRKHVICTLSGYLPLEAIEILRAELGKKNKEKKEKKEGKVADAKPEVVAEDAQLGRAHAHGASSAVLGMVTHLGVDRMLGKPGRRRALALATLVTRVLNPGPKLDVARTLLTSGRRSLGPMLGVSGASTDAIYATLDWLLEQQPKVERQLAARHLGDGGLALYDVSSSYFEGSQCKLGRHGYSRDHRGDRPQVVYGLLCSAHGCPVAVEAFAGNTADPQTVPSQVEKLRRQFNLRDIVLVGDRGMLTKARIREDLAPAGIGWVTALGTPLLRSLVTEGTLRPAPGDDYAMASVDSPQYPGERLIVCRNPSLAERRDLNRKALLQAAEEGLAELGERHRNGRIDRDAVNKGIGALNQRLRMAKHFRHTFGDDGAFVWERDEQSICAEASLDGIYVIRTNQPAERLGDADTVRAYKSLGLVERAFRSLKSLLRIRPIFHYRDRRVRAHLFLCMLGYHVEWHLRQAWADLLYNDPEPAPADHDPVQPRERSERACRRDSTHRAEDGVSLFSYRSLLDALDALVAAPIVFAPKGAKEIRVYRLSDLTEPVEKAFRLLGFKPHPPPARVLPQGHKISARQARQTHRRQPNPEVPAGK